MARKNTQQARTQLERVIRDNKRDIANPYVQDKWVEHENVQRAERELKKPDKPRRR